MDGSFVSLIKNRQTTVALKETKASTATRWGEITEISHILKGLTKTQQVSRRQGVLVIWQIREIADLEGKGGQGSRPNSSGHLNSEVAVWQCALQRSIWMKEKNAHFCIFFLCFSPHPGRSQTSNCRSVCIKSWWAAALWFPSAGPSIHTTTLVQHPRCMWS